MKQDGQPDLRDAPLSARENLLEEVFTCALPQSARRKLSLLALAEQLGNVSRACVLVGYHRASFYEFRRAYQTGGVSALLSQKRGPRNPHPSRVARDVEEQVLAYALEHPTHGQQRVADALRGRNVRISAAGVRAVWLRNGLETKQKRLLRLRLHTSQ
jgi:hypothetical protein